MVGRLLSTEGGRKDEDGEEQPGLLTGGLTPALEGPNSPRAPNFMDNAGGEDEGNEGLIDVESVQGKVKASSVKKVEDIVENYPDETVSVIRSWMTED
jgi:flagellar M-ring protein FliF